MGPIILHLITRFIEEYNNKLDGNFVREITSECLAGARINFIFYNVRVDDYCAVVRDIKLLART